CSEKRAKLTPAPSQVAPRGYDRPGQTRMDAPPSLNAANAAAVLALIVSKRGAVRRSRPSTRHQVRFPAALAPRSGPARPCLVAAVAPAPGPSAGAVGKCVGEKHRDARSSGTIRTPARGRKAG